MTTTGRRIAIPREFTPLIQRALANDFAGARELQRQYLPLMEVNFVESNPIPVKAAMALMGLLEPVWRCPCARPIPPISRRSKKCWKSLGLLAGRSVHAG